ncbi:unnamed protein product [Lactuca virosa]|uniref:Protein kinase domain-containing protein n=1 Tax=Lactuca virosa TaxID=75947 RepID=A0AAU9LWM8_9ASTR|nr:unnamed protein product [Lactuca virosa]
MADSLLALFSLAFFLFLNFPSISSLPTVSISHISSNQTLICALTKSPTQQQTRLNCTTTSSPDGFQLPINEGNRYPFVGIVGGAGFLCALSSPFSNPSTTPTSFIVCWRFLNNGSTLYKRVYLGPSLQDIDSGDSHVCGIVSATNQLLCWQWDQFNDDSNVNRSQFRSSVTVGENYVCGFSEFGEIRCVGSNSNTFNITNSSPVGNYSVISAGYNRVCAVNSTGGLDCWGDAMISKPNGVFKSVSMGDNRFCAIRDNGTVICWGGNGFSLPENLRQVSFEALQSNRDVIPGLCTTTCNCGTIPNYGSFCSRTLMICKPCVYNQDPPESVPPIVPPPLPPPRNSGWSTKMVAFLVVGIVGCSSILAVLIFLIFRFCKSNEGSRVHDSGPMEDIQITSQLQTSNRILVKKLSHLISTGNANHLEEFTLQTIINATDNFSDENRIGIGSFGSVYRAILPNGQKVAVKRAESTSSSSLPGGTKKRQEDTDNAFGVVLLELLSGLRAIHKNEAGERRNVVDVVVPYIVHEEMHRILDHKVPPPTPFEIEAVKYVGYLAVDCVTLEGRDRPCMSEVVSCLERALMACLTVPSFSRSSNSSSA